MKDDIKLQIFLSKHPLLVEKLRPLKVFILPGYFFVKRIIRINRRLIKRILWLLLGFYLLLLNYSRNIFSRKKLKYSNDVLIITSKDYLPNSNNENGASKDTQSIIEEIGSVVESFKLLQLDKSLGRNFNLLKINSENANLIRDSRIVIVTISGPIFGILLYTKICSKGKLVFRSHNVEVLHRFDWFLASKDLRSKVRNLNRMVAGFFSDCFAILFYDIVLSISEIEIGRFWSKFRLKEKVIYFPFKSPSWVRRNLFQNRPIRKYAAIVGSFSKGTLISKPSKTFIEAGWEMRFFLESVDLDLISYGENSNFDFCKHNFGFVKNLDQLMSQTSVLIMSSDLGWGFKTKIADAIELDQLVIVNRKLASKLGSWRNAIMELEDWADFKKSESLPDLRSQREMLLQSNSHLRKSALLSVLR